MNMQQIMMQAQKMQRELKKAKEELARKEFKVTKAGVVTVVMLGNKTVKSIDIDSDVFTPEYKEDTELMIASAINELIEQIESVEEEINEKITGRGGLPF